MALRSTCVCVHGRLLHGVLAAAAELYSEGSGLGVLKPRFLFFSGSDSAAESTCSATAVLESGVKDTGSFVEPGKRWVRSKHMGRPVYQEVELKITGREGSWKKTPASDLVGSTLLVSERPTLNDGVITCY
ncbi:hypothetical protein R1sor_012416 [Riccia sorocarpa]|uniref:Uncharacterized protein n=1 Tax=Riccia sorocarpa TaxID=122646 RepID=A0ABD3I3P9_9MARC